MRAATRNAAKAIGQREFMSLSHAIIQSDGATARRVETPHVQTENGKEKVSVFFCGGVCPGLS